MGVARIVAGANSTMPIPSDFSFFRTSSTGKADSNGVKTPTFMESSNALWQGSVPDFKLSGGAGATSQIRFELPGHLLRRPLPTMTQRAKDY